MNYLDWMRRFLRFSDEELVEHYFDALGVNDEQAGIYLKACVNSMVQRFIDSVIYYPTDRKGGDRDGNSNND